MTEEEMTKYKDKWCQEAYERGKAEATNELQTQLAISEHDREHNDYELAEAYKKIAALEKQIEKMKCCFNCGRFDTCSLHRPCRNYNEWQLKE